MRKGKMVAQGAHASMKAILDLGSYGLRGQDGMGGANTKVFELIIDDRIDAWLTGNFKKICVSVNSEAELLELHKRVAESGDHIIHALIQDSGLTEFGGVPTYTALAIGPDEDSKIDQFTKGLPLL